MESECGLFVDYVDSFASLGRRTGPAIPIPSIHQCARLRARAAFGRRAASPPAPTRRRSARLGPPPHSWAHLLPCPPPPVRGAAAARSGLPSPSRIRPRRGEPPSPNQAPERSSEARAAFSAVTASHPTALRCPGAPERAAACRARATCGAARNRSTARSRPPNRYRIPSVY